MDVDTLWWRVVNVLLGEPGDQILTDDRVESPPLVTSGHFLSHGGQEALGVEEPSHPKHLMGTQLTAPNPRLATRQGLKRVQLKVVPLVCRENTTF